MDKTNANNGFPPLYDAEDDTVSAECRLITTILVVFGLLVLPYPEQPIAICQYEKKVNRPVTSEECCKNSDQSCPKHPQVYIKRRNERLTWSQLINGDKNADVKDPSLTIERYIRWYTGIYKGNKFEAIKYLWRAFYNIYNDSKFLTWCEKKMAVVSDGMGISLNHTEGKGRRGSLARSASSLKKNVRQLKLKSGGIAYLSASSLKQRRNKLRETLVKHRKMVESKKQEEDEDGNKISTEADEQKWHTKESLILEDLEEINEQMEKLRKEAMKNFGDVYDKNKEIYRPNPSIYKKNKNTRKNVQEKGYTKDVIRELVLNEWESLSNFLDKQENFSVEIIASKYHELDSIFQFICNLPFVSNSRFAKLYQQRPKSIEEEIRDLTVQLRLENTRISIDTMMDDFNINENKEAWGRH